MFPTYTKVFLVAFSVGFPTKTLYISAVSHTYHVHPSPSTQISYSSILSLQLRTAV
jgi:hypothetical protein